VNRIILISKTPLGLFDAEVWVTAKGDGQHIDAVAVDMGIWEAIEKVVEAYWDDWGGETLIAAKALVEQLGSKEANHLPWRAVPDKPAPVHVGSWTQQTGEEK
jgi:hypothetical protein